MDDECAGNPAGDDRVDGDPAGDGPVGTGPAGDDRVEAGPEGPADDEGAGDDSAGAPRFERWRKRSASGAMMTGIALGLREALEQPRQQAAIVQEADGDPSGPDEPITLDFDPDHPEQSVAVVRPWLTGRHARDDAPSP